MKKIGTGRTAEVFLSDDSTAVKLFYDWVSPEQIRKEVTRAEIISSLYPEAPRFIRTQEWDGRPGLEMEYIEGEIGTAYLLRNLLRVRQMLEQLTGRQKELHRIQVPSLPGQMEKFSGDIDVCPYLSETDRSYLCDFLLEREEMDFLCHGDFHPENVLITPQGRMRVIDWLDAYRGDPMGDVARTYYLLSSAVLPDSRQSLSEKMTMRMRPVLAEQYFRYYYRNEKVFEKDWLTWQLIIHVARQQEGIEQEIPRLHQRIRILAERLFKKK